MNRYLFYILVALLTFGIGSFIAFKLFWNNSQQNDQILQNETVKSQPPPNGYATSSANKAENFPLIESKKSGKPFCNDKELKPIWEELEKDEIFNDYIEYVEEEINCREILEVKKLDLNGDGEKEFVIKGETSSLCGGTGNCGFWIFQKVGNQYRKLISDTTYLNYLENEETPIQIQKTRTKGFFNVFLKSHITSYQTSFRNYKFDGQKYIESKCIVEDEGEIFDCKE